MKIKTKHFTLDDGLQLTLRAPKIKDARALLDYLYNCSIESDFVLASPESVQKRTVKDEEAWVRSFNESPDSALFLVEIDGKIAGLSEVNRSSGPKIHHRGNIGISIRKEFWNRGIGHILFDEMIAFAAETDCVQLELGVLDNNPRARHLYEKKGFIYCGRIPKAVRQRDGSFADELMMVRIVKSGDRI